MNRRLLVALAAGVLGIAGYAFAQTINIPSALPLQQTDLVQVVKGQPTSQSFYAAPGMVAGQLEYSLQVPVTAFTISAASNIWWLYLNPAGTLATGTLNLPATPGDGQRFCLEDSQTQTAITIQAASGSNTTIASFGVTTPTALTANTVYCWFFNGTTRQWIQTQ